MSTLSRLPLAAAFALALSVPATAAGITLPMLGEIFCIGRLTNDMAPVLAILTPDLAALVAKAGGDPAALPWQSGGDYANTCDFVGASGTADTPQAFIAYGFREADKPGYADTLILKLVDERLRIDDITFAKGGSLRAKLGG